MNLATTDSKDRIAPPAMTESSRLTKGEMVAILNAHGVGRLLIVLREATYNVDDAIEAINEHQESFSSRAKRVVNAVIDTVLPR